MALNQITHSDNNNGNLPLSSHIPGHIHRSLREGAFIVCSALAVFLALALATYHPSDPGWSHSSTVHQVFNLGGRVGAWFADLFLFLFGFFAYLFPILVAYSGWLLFKGRRQPQRLQLYQVGVRALGFVLTLGAGAALAGLHIHGETVLLPLNVNTGGIAGDVVGNYMVGMVNFLGATLVLSALFLAGITLFTSFSWVRLVDITGRLTLGLVAWIKGQRNRWHENLEGRRSRQHRVEEAKADKKRNQRRPKPYIEPVRKKVKQSERVNRERQIPLFGPSGESGLPPLSLLDPAEPSKNVISKAALEVMSRQVELKLRDFNIEAEVVAVHPGPVITRFELNPAPGIKVSQITNLAKDLARSLSVISVRVVEVIPGKSTIGLEIPNEHREMVRLSEVIKTHQYEVAKSPLTLGLGKGIAGQPVVVDLIQMPHLLVAGTTGSGKSVAINAMVLSLLYKSSAENVRMIMIDPKMLELSVYEGIPHLLAPVVTDMKEAANALRWCVAEMDRRYRLMAGLGVRNIAGYNRKVKEAIKSKAPLPDPTFKSIDGKHEQRFLEPLCYIVVIIDELADMMMVVGKKVEELIARLAQKARASGIHLVLATQRPSVDVLTGLIKANIPSRIAFQVSSKIDSRTILDQMGAEQLLGHGDMLYLPPGTGVPIRVHGAFVDDHEVHKVVESLRRSGTPEYVDEILQGSSEVDEAFAGENGSDTEADPLYDEAVRIVTSTRRASISGVQRRLKIGYNRAARMIEHMEQVGVIGPREGNGEREVLAPPPP